MSYSLERVEAIRNYAVGLLHKAETTKMSKRDKSIAYARASAFLELARTYSYSGDEFLKELDLKGTMLAPYTSSFFTKVFKKTPLLEHFSLDYR